MIVEDSSRIAAIAMHSEMGSPDVNFDRVAELCRQAAGEGARFLLFPEECLTGSLNKSDISLTEAFPIAEQAMRLAGQGLPGLAADLDIAIVVGTIEPGGDRLLNSALVYGPMGHVATFRKLHMPNKTEFAWFRPGSELPVITLLGWTFGVGICYDCRFAEIFRVAALHGADFFLVANGASGYAELIGPDGDQTAQNEEHRRSLSRILPARAVDNGMYVVSANQAGRSGHAEFPGLCVAFDPDGASLGHSGPGEGILYVDVSREAVATARSGSCAVSHLRPEIYARPRLVDGLKGV